MRRAPANLFHAVMLGELFRSTKCALSRIARRIRVAAIDVHAVSNDDIHRILAERQEMAVVWSIEDVL